MARSSRCARPGGARDGGPHFAGPPPEQRASCGTGVGGALVAATLAIATALRQRTAVCTNALIGAAIGLVARTSARAPAPF
eukprot:11166249-Lingulodinium_polyedra.AAC.1